MTTCPICLDVCVIPVEVTCFPCKKNDSIHCNSLQRCCLPCCINYLQLNQLPQERAKSIKCLFCHETVNPRELQSPPYRIDYLCISNDSQERTFSCPECHDMTTSHHLEFVEHYLKECFPLKVSYCQECQRSLSTTLEQHQRECMARKMKCKHCSLICPANGIIDHIMSHIKESKERIELLQDILKKEMIMKNTLIYECQDLFHKIYVE